MPIQDDRIIIYFFIISTDKNRSTLYGKTKNHRVITYYNVHHS